MKKEMLNITNGDAFNVHLASLLNFRQEAIPFREAMMDGEATSDIYSNDFIKMRCGALSVSFDEYKSNMLVYDALCNNDYLEIKLWFGKDTFCQMNLLTLLAYLEQIEYNGNIILNYIDDETFEVEENNIPVKLGIYKELYNDVFIYKRMPQEIEVLNRRAIELYFDYHSNNGKLSCFVRDNFDKDEYTLVCLLLENSKEYGLSDLQAKKLIEKQKGEKTMIKFICYPKCTTCQKAKKWLDDNNISYELRDIKLDNPTLDELKEWYEKSGLPLKKFFNTSGLLYKSLELKDKLPTMTDDEILKLLSTDGMLVKRPLLIDDDFVLVGFREVEWQGKIAKHCNLK